MLGGLWDRPRCVGVKACVFCTGLTNFTVVSSAEAVGGGRAPLALSLCVEGGFAPTTMATPVEPAVRKFASEPAPWHRTSATRSPTLLTRAGSMVRSLSSKRLSSPDTRSVTIESLPKSPRSSLLRSLSRKLSRHSSDDEPGGALYDFSVSLPSPSVQRRAELTSVAGEASIGLDPSSAEAQHTPEPGRLKVMLRAVSRSFSLRNSVSLRRSTSHDNPIRSERSSESDARDEMELLASGCADRDFASVMHGATDLLVAAGLKPEDGGIGAWTAGPTTHTAAAKRLSPSATECHSLSATKCLSIPMPSRSCGHRWLSGRRALALAHV